MGFQSTIIVNNDRVHTLEENKNFGMEVAQGILSLGGGSYGTPIEIAHGAAKVIETHHQSGYMALVVGGYTAVPLGFAGSSDNPDLKGKTDEELKLVWLKNIARDMGYCLRKKR